ncbi:MAG: sortase [Candidatus Dojkabacteria bacterium]|nr:sortase [Candidatus Dojkabacteria bacterium]
MKKIIKILTTLFLVLLVIIPVFFLFVYPQYNNILINRSKFDIYKITKDTAIKILTKISPSQDLYAQEVLAASSMEETLSKENINLSEKILEENNTRVIIKSINIEGRISQGETANSMNEGFWHFPISAYPGELGNMVIIGHRYQFLPPAKNTFFNLDKIMIGDEIKVIDKYNEFTYIVTGKKDVNPNDISVLQPTNDYRLTLITCTPLWTHEKRLVITAKLDKLYKKV